MRVVLSLFVLLALGACADPGHPFGPEPMPFWKADAPSSEGVTSRQQRPDGSESAAPDAMTLEELLDEILGDAKTDRSEESRHPEPVRPGDDHEPFVEPIFGPDRIEEI